METEKTFFEEDGVVVTQSRFISGKKTFAMRNISSVEVGHISKSRIPPIVTGILGAVFGYYFDWQILAGLLIVIAILWLISIKDEYAVRITSNSGESDGYVSTNKEVVEQIVDAINQSIISLT